MPKGDRGKRLPLLLVAVLFLIPVLWPGILPPAAGDSHTVHSCVGFLWSSKFDGYYEHGCYGHDEPTSSFYSNWPHSGSNAAWRILLPRSSSNFPQGYFYATFWFGGIVFDPNSINNQAFLEFQFYPAAPAHTGGGSGGQDCTNAGAFNWNGNSLGNNQWFACAVVWQFGPPGCTTNCAETAAIAVPLNTPGTGDNIMVMNSGDSLQVSFAGVAQGAQGWNLAVNDLTQGVTGNIALQNNNVVLPPFYDQATVGNGIAWGADTVGPISFAYEIGHTLSTTASCQATGTPGDNVCDSYWPGRWVQTGQNQLSLPELGTQGNAVMPTQVGFTSSQGGVAEINNSACRAATQNANTNCWYPYYQFQAATASFTFGTTNVPGTTNDFGNINEFPANQVNGLWAQNLQNTNNAQDALSLGGTPAPGSDKDTYIDSSNQNTNYGKSDPILVGSSSSNPVSPTQVILVHFTLPQLPTGAIFQSATLTLLNYAESGSGCCAISVGALTKDWSENSVTWSSYGGVPSLSGNQIVTLSNVPCCASPDSFDVTFFVNQWLTGTTPNYGFGILPNSPSETIDFQSRESPFTFAVPTLAVTYKFAASPPTVPTTLHVTQTATATVSMTNSGLSSWFSPAATCAGCPVYRLGSQNPQSNTIWGLSRVDLASGTTVMPGQTYNFTFTITAPTNPGTYSFQWSIVAEGNQFQLWFGDLTINLQINVITPGPDFGMTSTPSALSLARGTSAQSNVTLTSLNGFQGTINLQSTISPQVTNGPTVSFTGTTSLTSASANSVISTSGQVSNPSNAFVQDGQSAVFTVPNTSSPASATYGFSTPSLPSNAAITKVRVLTLHQECGPNASSMNVYGTILLPGVGSTSSGFGFKFCAFGWGPIDITGMVGSWTANQIGQIQVTYSASVFSNQGNVAYSDLDVVYIEVTYSTPTIVVPQDGSASSTLTVSASSSTPANVYDVTLTGTSGSLSHSVTIPVYVSVFSVSAPTSLYHNVPVGRSAAYSLTVTSLGGYSGSVSLSLTNLQGHTMIPSCVTTQWSENPVPVSTSSAVTLTLSAPSGCSSNLGDYGFNILASDPSAPYSMSLPGYLDISDYNVFAVPASITTPDGGPAQTLTAIIQGYNGYPGDFSTLNGGTTTTANLYLSISQPITCVTTSPAQNIDTSKLATPGASDPSVDNFMTATFTMSSNANCPATTSPNSASINALDNGGQSRTSTFTIATSDFSINAVPNAITVFVGGSASATINVNSLNGFAGTVNLSVSPSSCTMSPVSVVLGSTAGSTLSCPEPVAGVYTVTVTGTSGLTSHSVQVTVFVTDFSLSVSPGSVTIPVGSSVTVNLAVSADQQWGSWSVYLFANGCPSGTTCQPLFYPTPAPGQSVTVPFTITAGAGSSAGNYVVTVTGQVGGLFHSVNINLAIQDFSLAANPAVVTFNTGSTGTSRIGLASLNGYAGTIAISTSSPTGVSTSCAPSSLSLGSGGNGASTCTFSSSTVGTYLVTITGTSGSTVHSATVTLNVVDFQLTATSPPSINKGSSGTSTITLTSLNGFSGTISLSASVVGAPSKGPFVFLQYVSVACSNGNPATDVLTITTQSNTARGTYTITVTATNGALTHTATITVTVN